MMAVQNKVKDDNNNNVMQWLLVFNPRHQILNI